MLNCTSLPHPVTKKGAILEADYPSFLMPVHQSAPLQYHFKGTHFNIGPNRL